MTLLSLSSCSNISSNSSENVSSISQTSTSQSNSNNIIQSLSVHLDENGDKKIYLLNDKNMLKIKIENWALTLGNIAAGMDEKYVVKVLDGEDYKKYILVYKYFLIGSPSGEEDSLYFIKYTNNSIKLLWNGNLPDYKYEYKDKKVRFTFADSGIAPSSFNKIIEGDISDTVNKMEDQKARIEPLSLNDFFNGKVKLELTDVGAQDYNGDKYDPYPICRTQ